VKRVEWTASALEDMAVFDRTVARRVKLAVERFAGMGTGDVKKLQGIDRRNSGCGSATGVSVLSWSETPSALCGFATAKTPIDEAS
jgi:hypothetical protein